MDRNGPAVELLLVEDNAADVSVVREAVAEYRLTIKLTLASDGEQALKILRNGFRPALIILDINLPKLSGLAVLEQYQRNGSPVVIFSSSCTEAEIFLALRLGARDCIRKLDNLTEYTRTVLEIIEKWAVL